MSSNSDPITIPHQPGKLDFQIVEKEVSVTQFRRKPSAVWAYLETAGTSSSSPAAASGIAQSCPSRRTRV